MPSERRDTSDIEITPEMIEAGKNVLYDWGMDYRGDSRTLISDELVVEIFGAMVAAKESGHQTPSDPG